MGRTEQEQLNIKTDNTPNAVRQITEPPGNPGDSLRLTLVRVSAVAWPYLAAPRVAARSTSRSASRSDNGAAHFGPVPAPGARQTMSFTRTRARDHCVPARQSAPFPAHVQAQTRGT
jgi:hypothetical protein